MSFYADLHVHSKYSRATSRDCDVEHLAYWGLRKGISVIGTGDFTHPAWRAELKDKLRPAEPGLFRLRDDVEREVRSWLGGACSAEVRFMLCVEISGIYKRHDRTRKVHNLVYAPDFETVDRIVERLDRIGNLGSDGRPILGLDSRDLLEIVLESGDGAYLVPAHIWTPWFSMLGSKSGFDDVEACFGDLSHHIFAVETGLSSDPAMNWRLSMLDRYRLVSNSDAHSPPKLGREATRFGTELDYFAIRRALETGEGFGGTVEFFPEEGKYHLDGHRKCGVRLTPEQTREHGGVCPVCKKGLTVGVMNRVAELADRPEDFEPRDHDPFSSFVPLPEMIAETVGTGAGSKKVARIYDRLISKVGPELYILDRAPIEDVRRAGSELLAESVSRMRIGKVIREAGYDGEYGVVRMFTAAELARRSGATLLFDDRWVVPEEAEGPAASAEASTDAVETPESTVADDAAGGVARVSAAAEVTKESSAEPELFGATSPLDGLDPEQAEAAATVGGPLLIVAGPGTGKTRTLTHRIAVLIRERGVDPRACLALTFTRRAAEELRERLAALLPDAADAVPVHTFHGLGHAILREHASRRGLSPDFRVAYGWEQLELLTEAMQLSERRAKRMLAEISRLKRTRTRAEPGSELEQAFAAYQRHLRARDQVDCDDLVALSVELLEEDPELLAAYRARHRFVSVDEYQDVDELQYQLVRLLVPPDGDLCAIGDPDQAIYGFRGADVGFFLRFQEDYPGAKLVHLTRNYRSGRCIVDASLQAIAPGSLVQGRRLEAQHEHALKLTVHAAPTAAAEAEFVVHTVERLIGGYSFFSVDSGRVEAGDASEYGFSDFAVLYRSAEQLEPLEEALSRSGIPFQRRSHARLSDDPEVRALMRALAQLHPRAPTLVDDLAALVRDAPQLEAAAELLRPLCRPGTGFDELAAAVAAGTGCDVWDPRADRLSLLTLHAAKGLEFPVVFMVGCEDGLLPLRFGGKDGDLAEERRLFFVGMTRAQQRLFLTHAHRRLRHGQLRDRELSPFVRDIRDNLLEHSRAQPRPKAAPARDQLSLF